MSLPPGTGSAPNAVVHVLLMKVRAEGYDRVLTQTVDDAQRLSAKIEGLLHVDIFGTDDRSYVLVTSEWTDVDTWGRGQWDQDVQRIIVNRFASAERVHMKLYRRIPAAGVTTGAQGRQEVYGDENLPHHAE